MKCVVTHPVVSVDIRPTQTETSLCLLQTINFHAYVIVDVSEECSASVFRSENI